MLEASRRDSEARDFWCECSIAGTHNCFSPDHNQPARELTERDMYKFLVGAAALATVGTCAYGADMPIKASPPPTVPVANWAGCYIGLNAGAMVGDDRYDLTMAGAFLLPVNLFSNPANSSQLNHSYSPSPVGFTGGGHIGCNWQNTTWIYGLEADIDGATRLDTNANYGPAGPFVGSGLLASSHTEEVTKQVEWYSTFRGRLGYTVMPNWLLYATGGIAVGELKSTTSVQFGADQFFLAGLGFVGSQTATRAGWTIGAGTEWALTNTWSIKAEYLFLDFGNFTYLSSCVNCVVFTGMWQTRVRADENVFRLGVNYKFGGPVSAKY
jgi:outer membrane immunogenic protein